MGKRHRSQPLAHLRLALTARCEPSVMTIPKPMRLLAVVTLALFCFLLLIFFRGPTTLNHPPGEHVKLKTWERDPNLDRMDMNFSICASN